jgi:hypothetical protein
MRRRIRGGALLALCLSTLHVAPAAATFHLIQVREIYPGSAANPDAEYVELQMWSSGQNFVDGHFLRSYDAGGGVIATSTFTANVAGGANQSTLVLATPQAEAQFGIAGDAALAPAGQLSPTGGAVCWETIDCVAWGSFSGALPSPAGSSASASGISDGMALRRSIARGCATLLDSADDTNQSLTDLEAVFPAPRPNSVPPSERSCVGTGGGVSGSPSGERRAPQTLLRRKPPRRTRDRTPSFRFVVDEAEAHFECRLDRKHFRRCGSPFTSRRLAYGPHRFQVRAVTSNGLADPTPAAYRFRVVRPG